MIRITAIAVGRVQGVGYRYYVRVCAAETGITGYVKNMPDGSVMVVTEGSRDAVESFIRLLWAQENLMIRVRDLFVTPGEATGEFVGFGVKW
jgi:acylphosphatase